MNVYKSILAYKLYQKFNNYTTISNIIGKTNLKKINKGILIKYYTLCKKINPAIIEYTYTDFLIDYKDDIKMYKEALAVYNIWNQGLTFQEFSKNKSISYSHLRYLLINGLDKGKQKIKGTLFSIIEINLSLEELSDYEIILKDGFCKLIGEKTSLENFRNKYKITFPVLPYFNDKYHLAFDGVIYNKIISII